MNSPIALRRRPPLLLAAILLLGVFALRAHDALLLPAFVDESLHIIRGKVVWSFSDLGESLNPKKLLYYYWIGLFGLNAPESLWLARTATALWAMLGAALTLALARRLFDGRAGLLALLLYALTPFMLFFERMALADAFTAVICLALAHASLTLARRPTIGQGAVVGALLGAAALAKLIALPLVLLPPVAIRLYAPLHRLKRERTRGGYFRPLIAAGVAFLLVLMPPFAYVAIKEITGTKDRVVVEEYLYTTDDRAGQIVDNTARVIQAALDLLSPVLVVLAVLLAVYLLRRRPRPAIFLLAAVLLPWLGVIGIAGALSTRYLVLGVPPLLVLVAGGLSALTRLKVPFLARLDREGRGEALIAGGALVWIALYAAPFIYTALTDPADLDLPARDRWEYFTNTSSGYALRDLARDLPALEPAGDGRIQVIGFLPSCHSLPLYWTVPNAVRLDCPLFKWDPAQQQAMTDHLLEWAEAHDPLYMAVERLSLYDLTRLPFEWTELAVYERPHGGVPVTLYQVRLNQ